MVKTTLNGSSTPTHLWVEAVNTTCYLQKIIYIRYILEKTPYGTVEGTETQHIILPSLWV